MKKILSVIIAVIMVLSFCSCGKKGGGSTNVSAGGGGSTANAEKAVSEMLDAMKKLDFKAVEKYVSLNSIKVTEDENGAITDANEIFKAAFSKLNYKILSSEKGEGGAVNVETEITTIDMQPIVNEYFKNALQFALENAFVDKKVSDEENKEKMTGFFKDAVSKVGTETKTSKVKIKVVKENGKWKIVSDDEFSEAVTGGIINAVKNMDDSFDYSQD